MFNRKVYTCKHNPEQFSIKQKGKEKVGLCIRCRRTIKYIEKPFDKGQFYWVCSEPDCDCDVT